MARNVYRKVATGEPLEVPAQLFNTLVDVANLQRSGQLQAVPSTPLVGQLPERGIVIPVKNLSGVDYDRFSVVRISSVLPISPSDNASHFKSRPYIFGATPNTAIDQTFVILQEPCASNKIARGLIAGITAVKVDMQRTDHKFADAIDGDATKLRSQHWGCVPILTGESGTGTKWQYVQMGAWKRGAVVRGKPSGDIAAGGTDSAFAVWSGARGSEAATGETLSVVNDSSCTIKGSQFAVAAFLADGSSWQFEIGKTS